MLINTHVENFTILYTTSSKMEQEKLLTNQHIAVKNNNATDQ